jgi:DNA-binding transcriptional LysR family regulator
VMRRDHPLASRDSVSWQDGVAAGMIAMATGTGIRLEMERGLAGTDRSGPLHEAEHPATLLAMVEAGVGVAPLPGLAWPEADHPVLLYLIKRVGRDLSPAGRALHRGILLGSQVFRDRAASGW